MTTTVGGTDWELNTAWQLVAAARAAGDAEQERLGMQRFAEGLRNVSVVAASQALIAILNARTEAEKKRDAALRRDINALTKAVKASTKVSQDTVNELHDVQRRVGHLEAQLGESKIDRADLRVHLQAIEQHLGMAPS